MLDPSSQQSHNIVRGHQAGRDINISLPSVGTSPSTMRTLIERYRVEMSNGTPIANLIDELVCYVGPSTSGDVQGLLRKLNRGHRADLINDARAMKEHFAKKLAKHQFSEAAQRIFAYMLGFILNRFRADVYPLITAGATRAQVDARSSRVLFAPATRRWSLFSLFCFN